VTILTLTFRQTFLVALLGGIAASAVGALVSVYLQRRQMEYDRDERSRQFDHERRLKESDRQFELAATFSAVLDRAFGAYMQVEGPAKFAQPGDDHSRLRGLLMEASDSYNALSTALGSLRIGFAD
jgi:hypothetical protein